MQSIDIDFSKLVGKILEEIIINEEKTCMTFTTINGDKYKMYHHQNCCESVYIEDIIGDIEDLIGSPIIMASEDSSNDNPPGVVKEYQNSFTWTFYNIATAKGHVIFRWYGESNGYYSEEVDFVQVG